MLRCVATHRRWESRTSSRSYVDENRIFQCDLFEWKSQHLSHSRAKIDLLILRSKQQFQEADCYHRRASLFSIHPPTAPWRFMCKYSSWEPNFCKKVQISPVWTSKSNRSNVSNSTNLARIAKFACIIQLHYTIGECSTFSWCIRCFISHLHAISQAKPKAHPRKSLIFVGRREASRWRLLETSLQISLVAFCFLQSTKEF